MSPAAFGATASSYWLAAELTARLGIPVEEALQQRDADVVQWKISMWRMAGSTAS